MGAAQRQPSPSRDSVLQWLARIEPTSTATAPLAKRKRSTLRRVEPKGCGRKRARLLVTPPVSSMADEVADEATPRALRLKLKRPASPSNSGSSSPSKSRTSSASYTSTQSSPLKPRRLPQAQVLFQGPGWDKDLFKESREIVEYARRVNAGIGVVPTYLKKEVERLEGEVAWLPRYVAEAQEQEHGLFTQAHFQDIIDCTREAMQTQAAEASWNNFVHSKLGEAALHLSGRGATMAFRNISTAKIASRDLVPSSIPGSFLERKMVDFALVLRPDDALQKRSPKTFARAHPALQTLNHTECAELQDTPITVSIETKVQGEGDSKGYMQLYTWAHAHFARLCSLVAAAGGKDDVLLPPLPLLLVQGSAWTLMIAQQSRDGVTKLYREGTTAESLTLLGVCKILALLRHLIVWSDTQYRAWLEAHALCSD